MILVLWGSLFDMAFNEDINNTEGDATLQDLKNGCLLLTITYSASVDDVVARQNEIMKTDAASIWFTNDDFKDLLKNLKSVSFLWMFKNRMDSICSECFRVFIV